MSNNNYKRHKTDSDNRIVTSKSKSNSTYDNNNTDNSTTLDDVNIIKYPVEQYSDVVVKYDNTEFHVHKQVLGGM